MDIYTLIALILISLLSLCFISFVSYDLWLNNENKSMYEKIYYYLLITVLSIISIIPILVNIITKEKLVSSYVDYEEINDILSHTTIVAKF